MSKILSIITFLVTINLRGSSAEEAFQSSPTRVCTLEHDLSYDFTECDKETNTLMAFFYYA